MIKINKSDLEAVAVKPSQYPEPNLKEIAFAGRSNVGKSSLLNLLTGRKSLARVSGNPGKTRTINFYIINDEFRIVDLPGYGYAEVSKKMRKVWDQMIFDYLCGRAQLKKAFVLIDSRRGIKDIDKEVMGILDRSAVPYHIILTKIDEVSDILTVEQQVMQDIAKFIAVYPSILKSSSKKKLGIDDIRFAIMDVINQK